MNQSNQDGLKNGFTLIELLVVIALIATLVALLFPALSQGKASANSALCKSNLRQIGIELSLYVDGFGCYPSNLVSFGGISFGTWWETIPANRSKVFRCPATATNNKTLPSFGSYGYNVAGGTGLPSVSP